MIKFFLIFLAKVLAVLDKETRRGNKDVFNIGVIENDLLIIRLNIIIQKSRNLFGTKSLL